MSVAAHQWCGALGKQAVCQSVVSLHAVIDAASMPLTWRLYPPKEWADPDDPCRAESGMPERIGHREKWRLALDMIDQVRSWHLRDRVVVANAGYGQIHGFRDALAERGVDYVIAVRGGLNAHPGHAVPEAPERVGGAVRPAQPRYRTLARSLKDLVLERGRTALRRCTWRQGSRGALRGRFLVMEVRPAGVAARRAALTRAGGRPAGDGVLPVETLIAGWPPHEEVPTDYWLSSLPADIVSRHLARWAKIRWRTEHDYREPKRGLGLDRYEGRTCRGWYHHVTLVSTAQTFLTLRRLDPDRRRSESVPGPGRVPGGAAVLDRRDRRRGLRGAGRDDGGAHGRDLVPVSDWGRRAGTSRPGLRPRRGQALLPRLLRVPPAKGPLPLPV
ncbi:MULTISPECIES: IS701 family transposase [unclassified Nocardiopsis]|uniref:IS701 family transposase n=1 Tax=unclassified Nocardiopsis TaxID=2649073 RepID=UPI001359ACD7|nr:MULTISPECIES: IS701 family transposase [unclassified Nocardiopsis]